MVVSLALSRYIHVTVNSRFDNKVRVSYSKMEIVEDFEDLEHELVREAMRMTGVTSGVEITTIADVPSRGTGLGSSSTVTVGLLNALHCFAGRKVTAEQLASEACEIEITVLGQPIGRQDQYAAAFGGLNAIYFTSEGVNVSPIDLDQQLQDRFESEFTLVFTNLTRSASAVLSEKPSSDIDKNLRLNNIRSQANQSLSHIECGDLDGLGKLLTDAWKEKRGISHSVSNNELDYLHDQLMNLGANGAKLLGAGGGGFFLVHGDKGLRRKIKQSLGEVNRIIPIEIDFDGSKIIHDGSE